MGGVRVFVSFDVEHDVELADRLCEQSRRGGSSFEVTARSEAGTPNERWCESVRRRIRDADQVIVICGEHTRDSERVDSELRIVQEEQKPYFMLWGRREQMCTMPARARRTESMYSWTREILMQRISETLRSGRLLDVPEQYKRP